MKAIYILIFTVSYLTLVLSCSESPTSKPDNNEKQAQEIDSSEIDSSQFEDTIVIPELSEDLVEFLKKKTKTYDLPFELDSAGYSEIMGAMDEGISSKYIKLFTDSLLKDNFTGEVEWRSKQLLEMNERKRKGEYEDYASSLDIGELRDIEGFMGPVLQINEHSFIILWSISYGSFEACPSYGGTLIVGSLVYNNELKNTVLLGESSGGGDPPYWGETSIYSSIFTDRIESWKTQLLCEGEEDKNGQEVVDTTRTEVTILIRETGFFLNK